MNTFNMLNTTLKVRLVSNFFQQIITTAFLPFIALYLNEMISTQFSGIYLTILVVINVPLGLFGGYIIDTFSKRSTLIIYQLILTLALLLMSFSLIENLTNILLFCLSYAVFSIIWGLQFPAMDAIIMDAITKDVENIVYKFDYWLENTATALGMFLGGYLYYTNKSMVLFIAATIFFFVFLAFLKWIPRSQNNRNVKKKYVLKEFFINYTNVFKNFKYLLLVFSITLIISVEMSMSSYVALRLQKQFEEIVLFNFYIDGVKMFSIIMIVNTIVVVFFTHFITKGYNFFKEKKYFLLGLFLYLIGYANITYLNSFSLLVFAMILAAIGEIIFSPVIQEKKYKITPPELRGSYSAINNLGFNIAELIARLGILLGTFISPLGMGVYTFILVLAGSIGLYFSILKK